MVDLVRWNTLHVERWPRRHPERNTRSPWMCIGSRLVRMFSWRALLYRNAPDKLNSVARAHEIWISCPNSALWLKPYLFVWAVTRQHVLIRNLSCLIRSPHSDTTLPSQKFSARSEHFSKRRFFQSSPVLCVKLNLPWGAGKHTQVETQAMPTVFIWFLVHT